MMGHAPHSPVPLPAGGALQGVVVAMVLWWAVSISFPTSLRVLGWNRLIEQPLAPVLGRFAIARILWDVRNHLRIEEPLAIGCNR